MKSSKKIKGKSVFIILLLTGTIVLIVTVGQRYKFKFIENTVSYITTPIQKLLNTAGKSSDRALGKFKDANKLIEANQILEEELAQLYYENNILKQYQDENKELKELLSLAERYKKYPSQGANIIAKDPGNWYKVFIIDQGSKAGFSEDDAILAGGGLVGHIVETGPLSSKVLSIIDDRSSVSAAVLRTGEIGVLKGDLELTAHGFCRFEIDIQSEIIKGDQIVTSHLSEIYPPGITIGIVEEIIISKNGLTQHAYVRPVVDFKQLKQVLILETKGS